LHDLQVPQLPPSLMFMDAQAGDPLSQEIRLTLHALFVPHVPPGAHAVTQLPFLQTLPELQLPLQQDSPFAPQATQFPPLQIWPPPQPVPS
jgi:hypothetical protein